MRTFILALLLAAVAWGTYGNVGKNQFVLLDDDLHITNNPSLSKGIDDGLLGIWSAPYQGLYIPVTYTFWAIQKAVVERFWGNLQGGPVPRETTSFVLHTLNLILHIANTILMFWLLCLLVKVEAAAFLGALLFCLHPVQVEPIAWISGTKDLLSGFFALAALVSYLGFSDLRKNGQKGFFEYALALICFVLAALSKPSTLVLPGIAWILEWMAGGTPARRSVIRLLPWVAVAIPLAILAKNFQPNTHMSFVSTFASRPLIASDALTFYFSKVLVPLGLSPDYGRHPSVFLKSGWRFVTWLVPLLLLAVLRRRSRPVRGAFALFVVALLPVLGFVPFYFQEFSTVADRYLYLAMLGPAVGLAYLSAAYPRPIAMGAITLFLGALCARSIDQAAHWRNSISLFTQTIRVNPDSVLAHNNLGTLLEETDQWVEAAYHYEEVIRVNPENLAGHYNMGRLLARLGKFDIAVPHLRKVIEKEPGVPDAHYTLGLIYLRTGRPELAKAHLTSVLRYRPTDTNTLIQLGNLFREERNCKTARRYYQASLDQKPLLGEAHFGIGKCFIQEGKPEEAARRFEAAALYEPKWKAPREALAGLQSGLGRKQ